MLYIFIINDASIRVDELLILIYQQKYVFAYLLI